MTSAKPIIATRDKNPDALQNQEDLQLVQLAE
jgi:hypothetical protein